MDNLKTMILSHLDMMDKLISKRSVLLKSSGNTIYNIFWIFYKTSNWFYAPEWMRVIEVLSAIELKKMIELTGAISLLIDNEEKFNELMEAVTENYLYSGKQKLPEKLKHLFDYKYKSIKYSETLKYLPESVSVIYKKINFIQHHSLMPSHQTNSLKVDIVECAWILNEIMIKSLIKITGVVGENKQKLIDSHNAVVKELRPL